MTTPNPDHSLKLLNTLPPPPGMQQRLEQHLVRHARRQATPSPTRLAPGWKLWSILALAAALFIAIITVPQHHPATAPLQANATNPPAPFHAPHPLAGPTLQTHPASRRLAPTHAHVTPQQTEAADNLPHTAPPLPLTAQERLLIDLARKPALAAADSFFQPVANHGLGPNALLELDHQQLTPLQPVALQSTALPPSPLHAISSTSPDVLGDLQ